MQELPLLPGTLHTHPLPPDTHRVTRGTPSMAGVSSLYPGYSSVKALPRERKNGQIHNSFCPPAAGGDRVLSMDVTSVAWARPLHPDRPWLRPGSGSRFTAGLRLLGMEGGAGEGTGCGGGAWARGAETSPGPASFPRRPGGGSRPDIGGDEPGAATRARPGSAAFPAVRVTTPCAGCCPELHASPSPSQCPRTGCAASSVTVQGPPGPARRPQDIDTSAVTSAERFRLV